MINYIFEKGHLLQQQLDECGKFTRENFIRHAAFSICLQRTLLYTISSESPSKHYRYPYRIIIQLGLW